MNEQAPQTLDQFAKRLLAERGLSEQLDEAVLDEMSKDLVTRMEDRINVELIAAVPAERLEELQGMMDDAAVSDEAIQQFFMSHVADYENLLARTLLDFRTSYLG